MTPEEADHQRNLRNTMYEGRGYPFGDKKINPEKKRDAHSYHEWLSHQGSFSHDQTAHLAMLESEERATGRVSYPEGHPRGNSLRAGRDANTDQLKRDGLWKAATTPSAATGGSGEGFGDDDVHIGSHAATPPPKAAPPVRTNRYGANCTACGGHVPPGGGSFTRGITGWSTKHHPSCPSE